MSSMSEQLPSFQIASAYPNRLAGRITKCPLRTITNIDELRAEGYQDEGVIVPDLERAEPLTDAELAAIMVPWETPDALRLVAVPQRTHAFMKALGKSGTDFTGSQGDVVAATETSYKETPPLLATSTINPTLGRRVGMHIDAGRPGTNLAQHMMGIVCGDGDRGITFAPQVTVDCVPEALRYATAPDARLERRQVIRQHVAALGSEAVAYTLWLQGSSPDGVFYEAYANLQPHTVLHDGTTWRATRPAAIHMIDTHRIGPESFPSIV
jgi:hypothetical protein